MAYDLDFKSYGKSLEQWKSYVEHSPLIIASPKAKKNNPRTGEVISINTPADITMNQDKFILTFRDGCIGDFVK